MSQPADIDIRDVWQIVRKRKWVIIIPAFSIFAVASLIAFLLPAIYKSETLILIETQKIPLDYVESTVTSQVEERLEIIEQRVMSRSRLDEIIEKFDLYSEYRESRTHEEIIDKMRNDINVEIVSAEGVDKKSGRPVAITVAFTLSYEGKDARTVQAVTSELASFYIGENLKVRVDASAMTTQFVADELEKIKGEIDKIGHEISSFKEQHLNELPEQLQVNMANLDRYERFLETSHRDLNSARSSLVFLRGQIVATDPDATMVSSYGQRVLSPKEQLELDRTNLIAMKAKLSENHPDLIELNNRIAQLEEEVKFSSEGEILKMSLAYKEKELNTLRSNYTAKHPDVIRTVSEIEDLKKRIKETAAVPGAEYANDPTNPAYINLQTQIESKRLEIEALEEREEEYKDLIKFYQERIANTPAVEKTLTAMQSDYDVARVNYQELVNKETRAKISESLENRQQGERFTIIDPALFPEEPYKPKRWAYVLIGLVLGLGGGATSGFLSEYLDQSFSSVTALRSFTDLPVLAALPRVVTPREQRRKRRQRIFLLLLAVIVIAALVIFVQAFLFKFDIWFVKFLREAQKILIQ